MKHKDLTIVITSFRSDTKINDCLNSIDKEIEVVLIENSDRLEFKKKIEENYSNVQCTLAGSNLGYAKGNNLGLSKVKTNYALILNPDSILSKKAINNFFLTIDKLNNNFAIIGPGLDNEKFINFKKRNINLYEANFVKGFAMFLKISEFKEIGFFDENIFIYLEEIDLCKRLKKKNKKIYIDTSIEIFHKGGSSHDEVVSFEMELSRNWHWMWSKFYFNKKYRGFFISLINSLPNFISSLFKFLIYKIVNTKKSKIYYYRLSGTFNSIIGKKSWYRPKI